MIITTFPTRNWNTQEDVTSSLFIKQKQHNRKNEQACDKIWNEPGGYPLGQKEIVLGGQAHLLFSSLVSSSCPLDTKFFVFIDLEIDS